MRNRKKGILVTAGTFAMALTSGYLHAGEEPVTKMNVILILADDFGWSDCTLFGNTSLYQTPNIERLAARGLLLPVPIRQVHYVHLHAPA